MDLATFERLLTPAGQRVLAGAEDLHDAGVDALRAGDQVRRLALDEHGDVPAGAAADLAAAATTQAVLRTRAVAKLGPDASRLLLTPDGLQQATRPEVAARRATRLAAALRGLRSAHEEHGEHEAHEAQGDDGRVGEGRVASPSRPSVMDLGCGIGADLLAFARAGLTVAGVDLDPVTAAVAAANLAGEVGGDAPASVTTADARTVDRSAYDAVFLDPARRTARGRTFDVDAYSPPWSFVEQVLAGPVPAVVKVAPGVPHDRIPSGVEAEWVSVDGEVKEATLWSAGLARVARRATVIRTRPTAHPTAHPGGAGHRAVYDVCELTDRDDPGRDAVGTGPVAAYLLEPDGAVVRAGLVTAVAAGVGGHLLDEHIAYVTTDRLGPPRRPGAVRPARAYRVLDELPYQEKRLKAALRERGVGRLTIKKRGVQVVPDELRRRLTLRGDAEATVVLTRVAGRGTALLVDPVAADWLP